MVNPGCSGRCSIANEILNEYRIMGGESIEF